MPNDIRSLSDLCGSLVLGRPLNDDLLRFAIGTMPGGSATDLLIDDLRAMGLVTADQVSRITHDQDEQDDHDSTE